MAQPTYTQLSQTEAQDSAEATNLEYQSAGIDGDVVAVFGQINNFFATTIPNSYQVEFDASDDEKKNNFALFSATANSSAYAGIDFETAWVTEYDKIY